MNKGFLYEKEIAEQSNKDWLLGAKPVKGIAENIPFEEYLPTGEVQRTPRGDMMDCTARSVNNILETKLNYLYKNKLLSEGNHKWVVDQGYVDKNGSIALSDAYTAILSGTSTNGNSLKAPIEAIRKYGCIPKSRLPLESHMSWNDYHRKSRVTPLIKDLGAEFAKRFPVNYEKVMKEDFGNIIAWDMLDVAGYAWSRPTNGIYPRINRTPNHAFAYIKTPAYIIFDNYEESPGDYIKHLASNYYLLHYGYRIILNEVNKKKIMTREEETQQDYTEILMREPDAGSKGYLKETREFTRQALLESDERGKMESWMGFLRSVKLLSGKTK